MRIERLLRRDYEGATSYFIEPSCFTKLSLPIRHHPTGPAIDFHIGNKVWIIDNMRQKVDGPSYQSVVCSAWQLQGRDLLSKFYED